MADQTSRHPEGLAKDIFVRIQDTYIPTDFVILDMGRNEEVPVLPRRPFLNNTNAVLHVGSGHVSFHIQGQTIRWPFNGFDMLKHFKNKQPRKQPRKVIKQVWQIKGSASMPTSPVIAVPSSSKK